MTNLYNEILRRFPEIRSSVSEGDEELPYVIMGDLSNWLERRSKEALTPEIINRVISFSKWCLEQPRGKDAGDDIATIYTVGFYEDLFRSDGTRAIIPKIATRQDLVAGADYLRAWVGTDNYEKALALFTPNTSLWKKKKKR